MGSGIYVMTMGVGICKERLVKIVQDPMLDRQQVHERDNEQ